MPRVGRVILANYPHHVVQRSHNRQVVSAGDEDYAYYLETLAEFKGLYGVRVYTWCLMTNHVHLLLQPDETIAGLCQLMKRLAERQTRVTATAWNGVAGWESHYKSRPAQTDGYLLACARYIELNPVRARMVEEPGQYRWSSYRHHVGTLPWMDDDPCYRALGETREHCQDAYAAVVRQGIPAGEWELIREALQRGQLTGGERFVAEVEGILRRRTELRRQGRPKKVKGLCVGIKSIYFLLPLRQGDSSAKETLYVHSFVFARFFLAAICLAIIHGCSVSYRLPNGDLRIVGVSVITVPGSPNAIGSAVRVQSIGAFAYDHGVEGGISVGYSDVSTVQIKEGGCFTSKIQTSEQ